MTSYKNPFHHISQRGLTFVEKGEKVVKNHHFATFFEKHCAFGDTLGECILEGFPMGDFQLFKLLWKLDRQVYLTILSDINLDFREAP